VTLIPRGRRLARDRTLQLTVNASSAFGVADALGRPLDGDRDGRVGGDFVTQATPPGRAGRPRLGAAAVDRLLEDGVLAVATARRAARRPAPAPG
jgi:hypothetical protein